ncbi:MAG: serine hydrolase domain-containing protein [Bacteroidota bacterium]
MKKYLTTVIGLFLLSCSNGQPPFAENGLINNGLEITRDQTDLICEKSKSFPENTQLSIAIIDSSIVKFVGITRINDTIGSTDNRHKIFEIGSISKVFTSTLLANFAINGKPELDDTIQDFTDTKMNTSEKITFKQLANHTSGLPRLPSNLNLLSSDPGNPYKNYDEEKLKEYLTEKLKLQRAPGTEFEYSNLGAGLLGYLLTEVSKSSYEELLNELIFSKYDMPSSTTNRDKVKDKLVKGLDNKGNETSNWDLNALVGAGGILSSVDDLTKFAIAQFDRHNTELYLTQQPTFTVSEHMQMGLGWHIIKTNNGKSEIIWHNGGTGGYTSSMALDTENKCGIIILSNVSAFHKDSGKIDDLCFGLMNTMWNSNDN